MLFFTALRGAKFFFEKFGPEATGGGRRIFYRLRSEGVPKMLFIFGANPKDLNPL
jgi:hypothetical protein